MKLLAVLIFIVGSMSFAADAEIKVTGKMTAVSTSYVSAVDGTFNVSYKNLDLPWGVRVFLHYGFQKSTFKNGTLIPSSDWNEVGNLELDATSPYSWYGSVTKQLYGRGSSSQYTALQFVLKVVLPDGTYFYENGSRSTMGYFEAVRPLESSTCPGYTVGAPECTLSMSIR